MFWNSSKNQLETLNEKCSHLETDVGRFRQQLQQAQETENRLKQQVAEKEHQLLLCQGIFGNMQYFNQGFGALQQSLSTLAGVLGEEKQTASEAAKASTEARSGNEEVVRNLKEVVGLTTDGAGNVDSLNERVEAIGNIVNMINDISEQTNLLALNAAIEAARAGESGRGFAVVADEVRNLSHRTNDATKEISEQVCKIQQATSQVQQQMQRMAEWVEELSGIGATTASRIHSTFELAQRLGGTMFSSSIRGFVELTKTDHMVYKFQIYQVLMGVSDKKADEFSDHTSCRLGKWYYHGIGRQTCSHLTAFSNLEQPHKEVHHWGIEAIKSYRSGKQEPAIEALHKMELASLKVMENLEEIAVSLQAESVPTSHGSNSD